MGMEKREEAQIERSQAVVRNALARVTALELPKATVETWAAMTLKQRADFKRTRATMLAAYDEALTMLADALNAQQTLPHVKT